MDFAFALGRDAISVFENTVEKLLASTVSEFGAVGPGTLPEKSGTSSRC